MLKKVSVIISIVLLTCTFSVQAFSFKPISQDYSPTGKESNHVFRVANTGTEKIAVKISVRPRYIEPDGTEIQGEESSLFMIYPRQIILNPDETRSIRVKWTGDSAPPAEIPFRIIAEQVPVSFTEVQPTQGGQITLTYRYEGNIYIVPAGAKANLSIKSIKRDIQTEVTTETVIETVRIEQGDEFIESEVEKILEKEIEHEYLVLEIENTGRRHSLLNNIELTLMRDENDPQPIILKDNALKGVTGENMLANSVREFRIPMPSGIWEGPVYGNIKQTPVK